MTDATPTVTVDISHYILKTIADALSDQMNPDGLVDGNPDPLLAEYLRVSNYLGNYEGTLEAPLPSVIIWNGVLRTRPDDHQQHIEELHEGLSDEVVENLVDIDALYAENKEALDD